ncbi:MAG TPA: tRNA (guanosine(37)-N1)-methyltransferase TrmD, partial [Bacillales bacterium]|nr:tRNA (guanosine(37)-N1)-methyltransferase TrmD [Bacillales bacterium]
MKIDVLSLFPEMFSGVFNQSILKKAQGDKRVSFRVTDFREFATNKHNKVDDYPYGGGEGMVLMPQPIFDAVEALKNEQTKRKPRVILLSPQGERHTQQ